jgi:hypothetical protein
VNRLWPFSTSEGTSLLPECRRSSCSSLRFIENAGPGYSFRRRLSFVQA